MLNRSKEQYRPACVRNPLFQTTPQARLPSRTFARSKTLKTYKVFNPVFLAIMYRDTPQPLEVARLLLALLRSRVFEWM